MAIVVDDIVHRALYVQVALQVTEGGGGQLGLADGLLVHQTSTLPWTVTFVCLVAFHVVQQRDLNTLVENSRITDGRVTCSRQQKTRRKRRLYSVQSEANNCPSSTDSLHIIARFSTASGFIFYARQPYRQVGYC